MRKFILVKVHRVPPLHWLLGNNVLRLLFLAGRPYAHSPFALNDPLYLPGYGIMASHLRAGMHALRHACTSAMNAPAGKCAKQHGHLEVVCSQGLLIQGTLTYPPTPWPASNPAAEEEAAEDDQGRTGATYIGELVHGVREGHGKYAWPPVRAAGPDAGADEPDAGSIPGACYEGGYVAGARHGKGTHDLPRRRAL